MALVKKCLRDQLRYLCSLQVALVITGKVVLYQGDSVPRESPILLAYVILETANNYKLIPKLLAQLAYELLLSYAGSLQR